MLERHTAGTIAFAVACQLVLPFMPGLFARCGKNVEPYLTSNAGKAIYATHKTASHLAPWAGLGVSA